jgi:2',3'-cyclic-nucleotide 2'-phosphodiesterase (5'-nucleotidase family)
MKRTIAPGVAAFVAAILVALIGLGASADSPTDPPVGPQGAVKLRLLGVNDLHGHLEPPRPGLGGAAWLDAHLDRATIAGRTIRVHAGDMAGASPLVSSWFHDEPSIEAANRMEFDVGTVGNHEFDEGGDELLRLLRGGQRGGPAALKRDADGALVNTSSPDYPGADFPYIGANTVDRNGELLLPPYEIVERAGVRVGFIGVTTESTPHFLLPRHSERFRFTDISEAVDRWVPDLQRRGVEAIVVLAHSGAPTQPGDSTSAAGEILGEATEMSDAVDVVIAGHSHSLLNLRVPNASGDGDKLVVEALSYGIAYDRIDITVDRATGDVVEKSADVPATSHRGVAGDPDTAAHVARHVDRVAPLAKRVVGNATAPLTRANGRLGDLAADAQLALSKADVAVVNGGSVRTDLEAGPLHYEELFAVHPYDFDVLRVELSGRDLTRLLEGPGSSQLYVAGLRAPFDPDATYTVAANELIATGPAFPALRDGARGSRAVGTEVEALTRYVERQR